MDILGIGPLEIFFILVIVLIIFGPNDIVKAARTIGRFLRKVVTSEGYRAFQQASKGMKDLPTTLMREAGLEEEDLKRMSGYADFEEATRDFENQISPWTTPPSKNLDQPKISEDSHPSETDSQPEEDQPESASPPPGSPFSQNIDE